MNRWMKSDRFLILLLGAILSFSVLGCSSTPIKASLAKPVAPDRVLGTIQPTVSNPADATVVCDNGLGIMAILFKVDGHEIAKIYSGEKVNFKINPGSHIFAVKMWDGTHVEVETFLKESERAFYRILIPGYGITIQKSAEVGGVP